MDVFSYYISHLCECKFIMPCEKFQFVGSLFVSYHMNVLGIMKLLYCELVFLLLSLWQPIEPFTEKL